MSYVSLKTPVPLLFMYYYGFDTSFRRSSHIHESTHCEQNYAINKKVENCDVFFTIAGHYRYLFVISGQQYVNYRRDVWVGLPFVKGFEP